MKNSTRRDTTKVGELTLDKVLKFGGFVRIPVSGSVPLASEVRSILDTRAFQRLRGVRQLGPTHFVFPGAVHTRFEHSLGTYALSLRYVEALLKNKEFYQLGIEAHILAKVLIAGALLHDIGHYSFSHLVEEIGRLPNVTLARHEDRASAIIMGSEIKEILVNEWRLNPTMVCQVITGKGLRDGLAVIASALNSVLDFDKMDYLIRDSIHCGVNFGLALDREQFLGGLRVDIENSRICLLTKAESYVAALLTVRNLMYNEVYWHKTVRAAGAMVKVLIYRLCEIGVLTSESLGVLLHSTDDMASVQLSCLAKKSKKRQLITLAAPLVYQGRGLYKRVYAFGMAFADGKPIAQRLFSEILNITRDETQLSTCVQIASSVEVAIRKFVPSIGRGDILVEVTPVRQGHDTFDVQKMRVFDERSGKHVAPSYDLEAADSLLDKCRRVFIFCQPDRSRYLKELTDTDWENVFYDASNKLSSPP